MSDRDAELRKVLGDYRGWLRKMAGVILGPASPDLEDLVQEGYIAMWRALGTFQEGRGSLPYWLTFKARARMLEIAEARSWLGRPKRHPHAAQREDDVLLDNMEDLGVAAPDLLGSTELAYHHGEIMAAIAALTPAQRRYVIARFWGGLSGKEMRELGVFSYDAHGLWDSRKNGAREKLREALAHLAPA
jgi:RNA polymerase sigma factor (sigma-70 family)